MNADNVHKLHLNISFILGKIQVAQNRQYLVGGKESLQESKNFMGILAKQNDVSISIFQQYIYIWV